MLSPIFAKPVKNADVTTVPITMPTRSPPAAICAASNSMLLTVMPSLHDAWPSGLPDGSLGLHVVALPTFRSHSSAEKVADARNVPSRTCKLPTIGGMRSGRESK